MIWDAVAAIAESLGAIAVVLTLIYVAREVTCRVPSTTSCAPRYATRQGLDQDV